MNDNILGLYNLHVLYSSEIKDGHT